MGSGYAVPLGTKSTEFRGPIYFHVERSFYAIVPVGIQLWVGLIIIALESGQDRDIRPQVPRPVARCNCFYILEEEKMRVITLVTGRSSFSRPFYH
jgi:hypothetical protein